jgi:hypothetical protein
MEAPALPISTSMLGLLPLAALLAIFLCLSPGNEIPLRVPFELTVLVLGRLKNERNLRNLRQLCPSLF